MNFNRVFVTGDTHGNFDWLADWCVKNKTTKNDALIICGDAGFMYYGADNWREKHMKQMVQDCSITILCVRGNHEARPVNYTDIQFVVVEPDPLVPSGYYYEPDYPDIWYIADGSDFRINNKRCLFIGGAYSVDKEYRQMMGWHWFADEELTREEQLNIMDKLGGCGQHPRFDFVFTHTCPNEAIPTDLFLTFIDQSRVSRNMENFLTEITNIIYFDRWFFGHYHADRHINENYTMLYNQIEQII